jgi:hypothetical protein
MFTRFFIKAMNIVLTILRWTLFPFMVFMVNPTKWVINRTIAFWEKVAFRKDEFGNDRFSIPRAGLAVATLGVLWSLLFVALDMTYYTSLYFLTRNVDEVVYMHNAQEVDPDHDIYSAQGCETLPCDTDTSIYFRIDPMLFNQLWTVLHHGKLYYGDYLAAAVPPVITKCVITSYGIRVKLFMRQWDIYPYLLDVSCEPIEMIGKGEDDPNAQ